MKITFFKKHLENEKDSEKMKITITEHSCESKCTFLWQKFKITNIYISRITEFKITFSFSKWILTI